MDRDFRELLKETQKAEEDFSEKNLNEAAKKGKGRDPKAGVRNRGDCVFPAGSSKVKDDKDHFPINNPDQARNALARVNQYDKAPAWYEGSLSDMKKKVASRVKSKYPSIKVSKAATESINEEYEDTIEPEMEAEGSVEGFDPDMEAAMNWIRDAEPNEIEEVYNEFVGRVSDDTMREELYQLVDSENERLIKMILAKVGSTECVKRESEENAGSECVKTEAEEISSEDPIASIADHVEMRAKVGKITTDLINDVIAQHDVEIFDAVIDLLAKKGIEVSESKVKKEA